MADIKANNGRVGFSDDGLEVNTGDIDSQEEKFVIDHDETDVRELIGKGSKITIHDDTAILADDGVIDLPADTCGRGFLIFDEYGTPYWADFDWDQYGSVNLLDGSGSAYISTSDTDTMLCVFDNGDNVRIKNRKGYAIRAMLDAKYTDNPLAPAFRVFSEPSGVDNLDPSLTINGTTVTPTFRYKGGDANGTDWEAWGYGETLTRQSVATAPDYNDGSPGLGSNDDSVKFNASDYYKNATAANQITTGDIVVECVFKFSAELKYIASTLATNGYVIILNTNKIGLYLNDAGGTITVYSNTDLTDGSWYHFMAFVNRDESSTTPAYGSQVYINGLASGTGVDCSAISGSLTSTAFALGADTTGSVATTATVAYLALWQQADWHQAGADGPTEWATVAAERFAKLAGYYPQVANGTYLPTTKTRAFNAYIDKVEQDGYRKLYYVGSEWLRMCSRLDSNDELVQGYLSETACQNLVQESEDLTTWWAQADAGDTHTANATVCPDGSISATSFEADLTNGSHGVYRSISMTADEYAFSVFGKAGDKDWLLLNVSVSGVTCYFDIANGTVGTASGCTGYIEGPFYGDFYRCCIVFTATAGSNAFFMYTADADNDPVVTGTGEVNTYLWGAQVEQSDYMTSPIRTTAGTATRLGDQLVYAAGDNIGGEDVGQGTIAFDALFPSYDKTDESSYFYWIGDGSASAERIYGQPTVADKFIPGTRGTNGSGNPGDPGAPDVDIVDGVKHSIRHTYETDSTLAYVDGTAGTEDTSCAIPDDVDTMYFAQNNSTTLQPNCLIQDFRIYAVPTLKG